MKQHEHHDETSRTAWHQVHLWLPGFSVRIVY